MRSEVPGLPIIQELVYSDASGRRASSVKPIQPPRPALLRDNWGVRGGRWGGKGGTFLRWGGDSYKRARPLVFSEVDVPAESPHDERPRIPPG